MNQEELQLLKENLEESRKTNQILKIILAILVVAIVGMIVCGILAFPKIATLLNALNDMTSQLQPAIAGIKDFDYASLNEAISQLKDAITSLNNFLSVFH